jgi:predicted phage tail protein
MTNNVIWPVDQEATNLELHVELCAQRYQQLDSRLNNLEEKIDYLTVKIDGFRTDLMKILIGTAGTVLVAIIALVGTLLTKL